MNQAPPTAGSNHKPGPTYSCPCPPIRPRPLVAPPASQADNPLRMPLPTILCSHCQHDRASLAANVTHNPLQPPPTGPTVPCRYCPPRRPMMLCNPCSSQQHPESPAATTLWDTQETLQPLLAPAHKTRPCPPVTPVSMTTPPFRAESFP
ncbi:unnamed protein product [Lepidochelys olivacea]